MAASACVCKGKTGALFGRACLAASKTYAHDIESMDPLQWGPCVAHAQWHGVLQKVGLVPCPNR